MVVEGAHCQAVCDGDGRSGVVKMQLALRLGGEGRGGKGRGGAYTNTLL